MSQKDLIRKRYQKQYRKKQKKLKKQNRLQVTSPVEENIANQLAVNSIVNYPSNIVNPKKHKRRKPNTSFIYNDVTLEVKEQFNIDKCKYCYFNNIINKEEMNDCASIRDISITGTCIHGVYFKRKKIYGRY